MQQQLTQRLLIFSQQLPNIVKGMIFNKFGFSPQDIKELSQDIAQSAVAATWIWIKKEIFSQSPPNIEGYARQSALYEVIDEQKRRGKWQQGELTETAVTSPPDFENNLDIQRIMKLIPSLKPPCEVMIKAIYLEGRSLTELAEEGIITAQEARRGVQRCLEHLRKKI